MFKRSAGITSFKLGVSYMVRFMMILLIKLVRIQIEEIRVVMSEEVNGEEEAPSVDARVQKLKIDFSYAADERLISNATLEMLKLGFKPDQEDANHKMEIFASQIVGRFKFPATHDPTNSIFSSSVKIDIGCLSGNYKDISLIQFIQLPQKGLLIKQIRRALGFQKNPADHLLKFKSDLLANDTIKTVASSAAEIDKNQSQTDIHAHGGPEFRGARARGPPNAKSRRKFTRKSK
jgi:hypothetical protein